MGVFCIFIFVGYVWENVDEGCGCSFGFGFGVERYRVC